MSSSSTPWYAWLLSAVLVGLGLASGATPARAQEQHDAYHPAPRDTISQEAYQGWKQYELNCSRCHGEYGVGTSFAPALVVSLSDSGRFKTGEIATKQLFIATVCGGRPDKGMPSWCALGLEMDKIQNIYAYLKGRADGKIHLGRPAQKAGPEPGKPSS
jgi:mono/diheme cytochrome c family protein